jgi:hypothetical protein
LSKAVTFLKFTQFWEVPVSLTFFFQADSDNATPLPYIFSDSLFAIILQFGALQYSQVKFTTNQQSLIDTISVQKVNS